ncbi:DUF262 domain-containing protein [Amycolatopsis anabasis]|uniref:DUF262 domain-containing protein n=1 Tax=Amycolatopsis anabasis TaxID=1840409 RepID=UPI001FE92FBC|nr:DUF262 domain-containing protein [Amycolatopsis anabasis]
MIGGLDRQQTATTLELEDLVMRTWAGHIRVPYFQRDFRWGQKEVAQLFDSIVKRYPIGSLLLWERHAEADTLRLGHLEVAAPELEQAHFVVDGQQRIISLANALNSEGARHAPFALACDVRNGGSFTTRLGSAQPWLVPVPILFDLPKLIKWFTDHSEASEFQEQAYNIATTIRQYKVPAYIVRHDNEAVLQDIFDRMNNYGKRLTRAEVFAALNAGDETRRDDNLDFSLIADHIRSDLSFGQLDEGTVLRAVLARRGPDVEREIRLEFAEDRKGQVDFPQEDRDAAFAEGEAALRRAVSFLQEEVGVPHISMLAYRFLLIVLTRVFAHYPEPDQRNRQLLRRWYWRTALAGPSLFKGGNTGTTRALNTRIRPGDLSGAIQELLATVPENRYPLPDLSKFKTSNGDTKIVLASWWGTDPRSPYTGEPYDISELSAFLEDRTTAADAVHNIFNRRVVSKEQWQWAANRVLLPDERVPSGELDTLLFDQPLVLNESTWRSMLDSHAFPANAVAASNSAKVSAENFLNARQKILHDRLESFLSAKCEWEFENTPPLDDFVLVDEDEDGDDSY